MPAITPVDAFGNPIHVGDTVIVSAASHTTAPGLVHAQVTGMSPSGELVHLVVTAVGRDQGSARNEPGMAMRRRAGRVQVTRPPELDAEIAQLLAEAETAGLIPQAAAQ
jgi:hypothetical protein